MLCFVLINSVLGFLNVWYAWLFSTGCRSPSYNRKGWLGVKHQVTYLLHRLLPFADVASATGVLQARKSTPAWSTTTGSASWSTVPTGSVTSASEASDCTCPKAARATSTSANGAFAGLAAFTTLSLFSSLCCCHVSYVSMAFDSSDGGYTLVVCVFEGVVVVDRFYI